MGEGLEKFLYDLQLDADLRSAFEKNPMAATAGYDLAAPERKALLGGDPAALRDLVGPDGAPPLIIYLPDQPSGDQ
jgi:hypothetical protein